MAMVQLLNEKGLSEQDLHVRAAQIKEQQAQLQAAQQLPLEPSPETMVAPGVSPSQY